MEVLESLAGTRTRSALDHLTRFLSGTGPLTPYAFTARGRQHCQTQLVDKLCW